MKTGEGNIIARYKSWKHVKGTTGGSFSEKYLD
jgi:hypothetical protein